MHPSVSTAAFQSPTSLGLTSSKTHSLSVSRSSFLVPLPTTRSACSILGTRAFPTKSLPSRFSAALNTSHNSNGNNTNTGNTNNPSSPVHADHLHAIKPTSPSARSHPVIKVATARSITPVRRPREDAAPRYTEEQALPSQRRTDLMAPKTTGVWALIPYVAASAVLMGMAWITKKRFSARQERLVDEFGEVVVMYGNSPDTTREIVSDYKRRLGPGILREGMFGSYLQYLITEKAIFPSTIQDVLLVKRLLKLNDNRFVKAVNNLASTLKDAPSLLGKLLFLSERTIAPEMTSKLSIIEHFPYSPSTVADLQRNMLERCFKEFVDEEIEQNAIEGPPMEAAAALRIEPNDAQTLFDSVVLARIKRKEAEAAKLAAAAAEEAIKPETPELDSPARSAEPTKASVHAYQCSECGYTLYPAAGREFKFYGDDFVCPACGAPKDKFVDLNDEE